MESIAELNHRHGIPNQVSFCQDSNGFIHVDVNNPWASARIALQGAQLTSWVPKGEEPVIWLSKEASFLKGKSIRGGAPVCWPWFGPHESQGDFPAHGFARTALWEILRVETQTDGTTQLTFLLPETAFPKNQWPYATTLKSHITIGSHLEVDLVTHNLGSQPIIIGQALHTYFRVEDVRTVRLLGLEECIYLDKVEGGDRKVQKGSVNFTQETDRIYLGATQDILIEDPLMKRQIRITKNGSASTVVWNPWIEKSAKLGDMGEEGYLHMVCVENANAAEDVITLAPGAEHHLWVRYSIL
ncbi:D-hexose-6-phosphate mutarotase [Ferrovum myxofaciens]|uniref:Putative glucose-6-phosphate 1-epimerase n=1 Tax=Ferrovum myxofaciens TaxID=416213 RepID=A0A9E6MWK9_9PROT|nr:D-hexose-6-phosphate mutarotase [Ferrovum myxofaciens]QKE39534.1 MAG: D-hexose-6-phosphate mutarotase [Ferrovum myxofaciens]QWY74816.1 MAG: D-hexose-6-phosphate mutarotase [Ferrovum myxofaciens]QWY77564.1 MAG: D-hexose-6-phosphate mutarotase [Ferrovum myxofaciens]